MTRLIVKAHTLTDGPGTLYRDPQDTYLSLQSIVSNISASPGIKGATRAHGNTRVRTQTHSHGHSRAHMHTQAQANTDAHVRAHRRACTNTTSTTDRAGSGITVRAEKIRTRVPTPDSINALITGLDPTIRSPPPARSHRSKLSKFSAF